MGELTSQTSKRTAVALAGLGIGALLAYQVYQKLKEVKKSDGTLSPKLTAVGPTLKDKVAKRNEYWKKVEALGKKFKGATELEFRSTSFLVELIIVTELLLKDDLFSMLERHREESTVTLSDFEKYMEVKKIHLNEISLLWSTNIKIVLRDLELESFNDFIVNSPFLPSLIDYSIQRISQEQTRGPRAGITEDKAKECLRSVTNIYDSITSTENLNKFEDLSKNVNDYLEDYSKLKLQMSYSDLRLWIEEYGSDYTMSLLQEFKEKQRLLVSGVSVQALE